MALRNPLPHPPRHILLVKGHSAGVGDILRSSAAWRALKDRWPDATLHAVLISRDPQYVSSSLMQHHHLLHSYHVLDKRGSGLAGWRALADGLAGIARQVQADLIVDCEPSGLRSSTLVAWVARQVQVATVGIAEFPGRRWFYDRAAPSTAAYARRLGVSLPMDYTDRDFVALAALGIEREGRPIELRATAQAREDWQGLRAQLGLQADALMLGLNIGCGTPDAVVKRPPLPAISDLLLGLQHALRAMGGGRPLAVLLTGAPFERDVNEAFVALHQPRDPMPLIDLAGATSLPGLAGVIEACRLFISTDSGPYHMAVAQRVPTLALFNRDDRTHFHQHDWVRCVLLRNAADAPACIAAGEALLGG